MVIEINNLFFSYESTPLLKNISLHIRKGEFIGIMGPNGGGKTTLLRLITGFLKPDKGRIFVKAKIGYVPQIQRTDRDFPICVQELILLGALAKSSYLGIYPKEVKKKAYTLMERLGLLPYKRKVFGSLSGGLAQRALFARALLSNPDLLLLDEPTANIDPVSTKVIFDLLEEIRENKTILLVTHDLKTIIEKVSRMICVQKTVSSFLPKDVCEHFALGLYHTPLIGQSEEHFKLKKAPHALGIHR